MPTALKYPTWLLPPQGVPPVINGAAHAPRPHTPFAHDKPAPKRDARAVEVNGGVYENVRTAAVMLGCGTGAIYQRIKRGAARYL